MKASVIILIVSFISFFALKTKGQTCTVGIGSGVNLVTNGDFSDGYTGWTYDATNYTAFTPCGSACYSVPGKIYVGTNTKNFNLAFTRINDHTSSSDSMFLQVDGVCTAGIDLWKEVNIPVSIGTTYYFSVWVTSLDNASIAAPGELQFVINGAPQATTIKANQTPGVWQQYSTTWVSTTNSPITIEIQNITTMNCNNGVDFGVDDISFTPGCIAGSPGPVPNLGADFSICGKTTPFNINPNFNPATAARNDVNYTWYKNGVVVPAASGTGPSFYNYSVTGAGTYQVCVDSGLPTPSCPKSDIVNITSTYSINLGGPYTLCNPATQTLDAVYTGPGVTYQWYLNGTALADTITNAKGRTYTVTSPGTYYVIVKDPICGQEMGSAVVTSNVPIPNNGYYCPSTGTSSLSVTGSGNYYWFSSASGGSALNTTASTSYNASGLTGAGPYTFYVQDSTPTPLHVGPPVTGNGFTNPVNVGKGGSAGIDMTTQLIFNALAPFVLDSITVIPYAYSCPYQINFRILNSSGAVVGTSTYTVSGANCILGAPSSPIAVPVNISVPQGTGYQLLLDGFSTNIVLYDNGNASGSQPTPRLYYYPTSYSNAVTFVSNLAVNGSNGGFSLYYDPDAIPGYLNWKITKYPPCGRVPVTATENCAAPVKFINFNVKDAGSSILLTWQTATEQNSDYFSIEKSTDGLSFNSIGTIKAAGNSENILSYSYFDKSPSDGYTYYRIVEYDKDGSTTNSSIKSVDINSNDLIVMPNPSAGNFTVTGKTTASALVYISIVNSLGQQIYEILSSTAQEYFTQVININNVPSGVYYLQVQSADNSWVKKVVKE